MFGVAQNQKGDYNLSGNTKSAWSDAQRMESARDSVCPKCIAPVNLETATEFFSVFHSTLQLTGSELPK